MTNSERLVLTMGDPSGVGAEVAIKALMDLEPLQRAKISIIGDIATLERAAKATGTNATFTDDIASPSQGAIAVDHVPVDGLPGQFGVLDPACGEASFRYIERAVKRVADGDAACIITAPINKEALNAAGHHYDGHTGMLAALTGSKTSWMLLASERLKVIHVSTHVALSHAIGRATPERVYQTVLTGHRHLQQMGYDDPRIAVAGLNPHCGENGLFGTEDEDAIRPGVERARAEGINVEGPISADTLYYRAYNGAFDLVVAQYHDQGHIPIKLVAFDEAVNVSLGLPIYRTSVDHGTAFDIAGKGIAKHVNMHAAIAYARRLAEGRARVLGK